MRIRSPPGSTRASASSRTPARRCSAARRSSAALEAFCAGGDPSGCACSRPTARRACGGCSRASTRRCARRARARPRARRATERSTSRPRFAPRRSARRRRPSATATQRRNAGEALRVATRGSLPEKLVDLVGDSPGARAAYESGAQGGRARALEELAAHDRDSCRSCSSASPPSTPPRSGASRPSTSRISSSPRATCCATTPTVREATQLRFRMVMVDEFQDTNRLQCELIDLVAHPDLTEVFTVGRRVPVDLRLPARRPRGLPRAPRAGANLLALTRNYRSRPQVLAAVNHLFGDAFGDDYQPLAASAEFADPCSATRSSCSSPTRRASPGARALAHGRGAAHREPRARARRLGRGRARRDRRALRRGHRRRALRGGAPAGRGCRPSARPAAATSGSSRSSTSSRTCGLLHNRYDDVALTTVLASPFVGVSNDALVLRRNAVAAAALHRARARRFPSSSTERRAPPARVPPALRATRARVRPRRARGAVRPRRRASTTTTSPCSHAGTGRAASPTCASSDGSRASTRPSAAPTSKGSSASFASRMRSARRSSRPCRGGGGGAVRLLTIHAAKGLEFKVVIVADAGRDVGGPRGPDEIVALSDGRFGFRMVHPTRGDRRACSTGTP